MSRDQETNIPSLASVSLKLVIGALIAVVGIGVIRFLMNWLALPTGEIQYWLAGLAYLWINAVTLTIGWRLFWFAYEKKQHALRCKAKREKAADQEQIQKIIDAMQMLQNRGIWIALLFHVASAAAIYWASGFITQNMAYRLIAVGISVAIAIVKPIYIFADTAIRMLVELDRECQFPEKTVQDLIAKQDALGDLEERMKTLLRESKEERGKQEEKFGKTLDNLNQTLEKERKARDLEVQKYKDLATELQTAIAAFREAVIVALSKLANDDSYAMECLRVVREKSEFRGLLGIDKVSLDQLVEAIMKAVQAPQGKNKKQAVPPTNG